MSEDDPDGGIGGIDSDILERISQRFDGSTRFASVAYRPADAPNAVIADYDLGYFPVAVDWAYLRVEWFQSDDFHVHYLEQYEDGSSWECRWDRHPNEHNTRSHFHPPPDAATSGEDASYPWDWRDVLTRILSELDERVKAFWD